MITVCQNALFDSNSIHLPIILTEIEFSFTIFIK